MTTKMNRIVLGLLVVVLLLPLGLTGCKSKPALGSKDNPIILSMVPSGDTAKVLAGGEAVAKLLSDETGYVIKANVPTSYSAVIEALGAGKAQMAALATFAYLQAHQKYGVEVALVATRYGTPYYKGEIIAGADTGIKSIADVKGKKMCWVDASSTSGYIVPRVMLKAAGVDPDKDLAQQVEAGSHDNVVLSVYRGDCDCGATYVDARGNIEKDFPDVKTKVVVIAESAEIPNDGLQFVKDFPADMKAKIVKAFVAMMKTDEGKAAMKDSYQWEDVIEKDDTFYDGFRKTLDAAGVKIEELAPK